MSSSTSTRRTVLSAVVLTSLTLMLALASQASAKRVEKLTAVTAGVGHVRGTAAELQGTVRPAGQAVTYYFQFGPTNGYGSVTPSGKQVAGTAAFKVILTASPFLAKYHYRLVVTSAAGTTVFGKDKTYTPKTSHVTVTVDKPPFGQNVVNEPITITGALSGSTAIANRMVALQSSPYPYTQPFVSVGSPLATSSSGRFSFRVAKLTQNTQYRVVTVEPAPAESRVVTELAAVHVTLHVRLSSHRGLVRLFGTVSPAEPGAHVLFQLEKTATRRQPPKSERAEERDELPQFSSKYATKTKSSGRRFSSVITVRSGGRYRAFVSLPKGPLASGYSSTVLLRAAPSTKKSKH